MNYPLIWRFFYCFIIPTVAILENDGQHIKILLIMFTTLFFITITLYEADIA